MVCEKCWRDAWDGGYYGGCETQTTDTWNYLRREKTSLAQKNSKAVN